VRDYRIRLLGTADSLRTTCALDLLSERVALRCRKGSMSQTSFPHSVPLSRQPLPSTGSLRARFPGFISTMGRSDSPPSVPVGSFPCSLFRSRHRRAPPMADQGFGLPAPLPAFSGWRRWGLPEPALSVAEGFLADLRSHALLQRLRWTHRRQAQCSTLSLSTLHLFGCPRGARLASGWRPPLAGRDSYPQGPFERLPRLRCHL